MICVEQAEGNHVCVLTAPALSPGLHNPRVPDVFLPFLEDYAVKHRCTLVRAEVGAPENGPCPAGYRRETDSDGREWLVRHLELWDLCDREGHPTGQVWDRRNAERIPEGTYHIVCDVLILNREGEYLLTQRDLRKETHPGEWEASGGGSALMGETPLEAARREMLEETGLTPADMELVGVTLHGRGLYYSYLVHTEDARDSVRLQEGETVDYRWVTPAQLIAITREEGGLKAHNERYRSYLDQLEETLKNRS